MFWWVFPPNLTRPGNDLQAVKSPLCCGQQELLAQPGPQAGRCAGRWPRACPSPLQQRCSAPRTPRTGRAGEGSLPPLAELQEGPERTRSIRDSEGQVVGGRPSKPERSSAGVRAVLPVLVECFLHSRMGLFSPEEKGSGKTLLLSTNTRKEAATR